MPKKKQSGVSELDQAADVIARAEHLYPKLLATRDKLARELSTVNQALARMEQVVDRKAPAPRAARPIQAAANGAGTLGSLVVSVLSAASAPISASELVAAVRKHKK